jgi:hypothetical protein
MLQLTEGGGTPRSRGLRVGARNDERANHEKQLATNDTNLHEKRTCVLCETFVSFVVRLSFLPQRTQGKSHKGHKTNAHCFWGLRVGARNDERAKNERAKARKHENQQWRLAPLSNTKADKSGTKYEFNVFLPYFFLIKSTKKSKIAIVQTVQDCENFFIATLLPNFL